jgi:D-threo-aldose 1-dehydrogenase
MNTATKQGRALPHRSLGRKGLRISSLGLGGAPLGELFERLPEHQADAVVQAALDAGITFFDTAPWYGHGLSEHRMGRGLRQVDRGTVFVSTKVGRVYRRPAKPTDFSTAPWAGGLHFELRFDYGAEGIVRSYEDSLLRLGLNRADCLVIHDLDQLYHPGAELIRRQGELERSGWAALEALRRSGEICAIGAGINERSTMNYFLEHFDVDFFLVAMPYTLLDQAPLAAELAECQSRGIDVVIGSPYASGILATGPVAGAVYNYAPAPKAILDKTRRIAAVCEDFGVSLQAAALQFPLAHPAVKAVIPGATSPAIVAANVANIGQLIPAEFWDGLKVRGLLVADAPVPGSPSNE